jgi:hypothetical protein
MGFDGQRDSGRWGAVASPRVPPSASRPATHERLVFRLTLLAGFPGVAVSLVLLWRGGYSGKVEWTLGLLVIGSWMIAALVLRERVVRPLQTLSNMLAALREGDYSIRARGADREDALGLAFLESNLLGETLRTQRLGAMEATALLRTVMSEIDVAVFAFDDENRVRLVNRAGARRMAPPPHSPPGSHGRAGGPGRWPAGSFPANHGRHLSRRIGAMGSAPRRLSPGRAPTHAARPRRRQQNPAGRRAAGVATAGARVES